MSVETFKFTPLRMNTPLDNLTAAISVLQTQILASDTEFNPQVVFGTWSFPTDQMQVAVALLVAMLGGGGEPEVAARSGLIFLRRSLWRMGKLSRLFLL